MCTFLGWASHLVYQQLGPNMMSLCVTLTHNQLYTFEYLHTTSFSVPISQSNWHKKSSMGTLVCTPLRVHPACENMNNAVMSPHPNLWWWDAVHSEPILLYPGWPHTHIICGISAVSGMYFANLTNFLISSQFWSRLLTQSQMTQSTQMLSDFVSRWGFVVAVEKTSSLKGTWVAIHPITEVDMILNPKSRKKTIQIYVVPQFMSHIPGFWMCTHD